MMLTSVLTAEARERLNRVAIVKPDNARAVEDHIMKMARGGKLTAKVRGPPAFSKAHVVIDAVCTLLLVAARRLPKTILFAFWRR